MNTKLPLKLSVKDLIAKKHSLEGKAKFHEKNFPITIQNQNDGKLVRVPFQVMGVTDNEILVRVSGPSGVYVQDHVKFKEMEESLIIESNVIFLEITNNQNKFDTIEIFVK